MKQKILQIAIKRRRGGAGHIKYPQGGADMDVIQRLNELRAERKMSVYRLAELSGVNQSTLANTFSRGTAPSLKNLELMCAALGLSLSQFFSDGEAAVPLTVDEAGLIQNYRKLPDELKQSVANIVNTVPDLKN